MIKRNFPKKKIKRSGKMLRPSKILQKKMVLPGKDIFKKLVAGNTPIQEGIYLIYYEPNPPHADSNIKKVAGVGIANFNKGQWGVNYDVKAYFGPIPGLNLSSLLKYNPPYLINQIFYIATLEQAFTYYYTSGPYAIYILAALQSPLKNHFIFCLDTENLLPFPVSKYKVRNDGTAIWKTLSDKAIKKYKKRIKELR